jgi:lysophospholipase L1-like esterase
VGALGRPDRMTGGAGTARRDDARTSRRWRAVALAGLLGLGAVAGCAAGPAPGAAVDSVVMTRPDAVLVPPGSRYAALGSSFAAGPGLPPVADEPCRRSAANYPRQVADALRLELVDVTCSGTTTDNVLTKPHDANGVEVPPQIEAVPPDAALVTVTIGGNDLALATTATDLACLDAGECAGFTVDRERVGRYADELEARLVVALEAVREAAPRARVVLVTYPQIVPAAGGTCPAVAMSEDSARYVAELERRLRDASAAAAERTGTVLVDAHTASAGRDACSPDPWVGGYPAAEPDGQAFHPTAAGMAGQADLVVAALSPP